MLFCQICLIFQMSVLYFCGEGEYLVYSEFSYSTQGNHPWQDSRYHMGYQGSKLVWVCANKYPAHFSIPMTYCWHFLNVGHFSINVIAYYCFNLKFLRNVLNIFSCTVAYSISLSCDFSSASLPVLKIVFFCCHILRFFFSPQNIAHFQARAIVQPMGPLPCTLLTWIHIWSVLSAPLGVIPMCRTRNNP